MYGDDYGRGPRKPVNVGDELEVTIEAVGEKGDGIAKKEGFVLFIPNTKQGDHVKVRVTKVLRKVGFAEVIGEGSAPAEAPAEEAQEAAPEEEEIPQGEESEDFGEEAAPEATEEAPAEETASEEEPVTCEDDTCDADHSEAPAEEEKTEEPAAE
jgi:predicted RNA-binding protein with TRAM domain